ncbi:MULTISPECIES: CorA family divalent cation transporter [unclassified Methanoregula]|uniref:CorA family divalent cation transporter n=1 Tax=unclassified Methanoregula TaxID=2649730 RepID=UPI0009D4A909|nr:MULTISPECIES: CorA family divalent cation transporter [unclassified Methanoregula]OPX64347.1 MAG: CorA-like Mg2+ transporter protein [Methanoregula sp. PtaB.Bin085]OPY33528.1 MAG: CorA-like Mg2+ transporter protein [Methanoregula sp. PtaU1.Bin006]
MAGEQGSPITAGESHEILPAYEERGFCVVCKNGGTQTTASRSIGDIMAFTGGTDLAWIDYVVEDVEHDVRTAALTLGFSELLINTLLKSQKTAYEDLDDELGLLLPAIYMQGFDIRLEPLYIFIRKNVIVTLHSREVRRFFRMRRYAGTLMRKIPANILPSDKITHLLIRIIDENNSRNFDYLSGIEEQGDTLSRELADPKTPREVIGPKIYLMKHALIVYVGGLWATVDTLNSLRYGDAELLTDDEKILGRINALIGELQAQIGLAEHLSEVLASGLEVLQSIYNNQLQILNNKLALLGAYLAIIATALLVPNTIATVAGNSMFQFNATHIPLYLGTIVTTTIISTFLAWWGVKRLGLLPETPD